MHLSPDTYISVRLDAICTRHQYTDDPAPALDELRAAAGGRDDILTESVGTWVGYFEDEYTRTLCDALRELPGLEPWIELGKHRRHTLGHSTPSILGHGKFKNEGLN
jgi:hypothetical protein